MYPPRKISDFEEEKVVLFSLGRRIEKRIRKVRRTQKVAAEATGFVIRRRRSDATPSPHALPEAPPTALLCSLFSIRQPKCQ